jgi:anti-sigma factor RsiW
MIGPGMIGGHLGDRVSALLDGQLSPAEEDRAWEHVHACHFCRDRVEREGWVKTRLSALTFGSAAAPDRLKHALVGAQAGLPPGDALLVMSARSRRGSLVAIGGGAAGAAVLGVLALGAAPANAPTIDRRAPINLPGTSLVNPGVSPRTGLPTITPTAARRSR